MFFENVSQEYNLKDFFFGSKIQNQSYAIDDYEIINDTVLKIINYDEINNTVIDEKIIVIKSDSNIHNNVHNIKQFINEKNLFLERTSMEEIYLVE